MTVSAYQEESIGAEDIDEDRPIHPPFDVEKLADKSNDNTNEFVPRVREEVHDSSFATYAKQVRAQSDEAELDKDYPKGAACCHSQIIRVEIASCTSYYAR